LELLAVRPRSAVELAADLGVHQRTARRMLRRLADEGYIAADPYEHRRFTPTMRVVALAGQVIERSKLTMAAAPHVAKLHDQLHEDCHLCVPSHLSALCLVHRASAVNGDGLRPHLRELVPCHCTAAGKAILAWRKPWRDAVLKYPLDRFTDRTLTDRGRLREDLERTVARGYSIENREFQDGTRAVGAPVFSRGEVVAALAVVAPTARLAADRCAEIGQAVMRVTVNLARDVEA
jgi:IclR family acetate operon transcriptional repressor